MKRSRIRIHCLRTLLALLSIASGIPAFSETAPAPVHGLWVWKSPTVLEAPRGAEALRDFCKSAGVNEVYVSISANSFASEQGQLANLISLLHRSGIRVEALLSSADADEAGKHRDTLLSHVRGIVEFNRKHSTNRFDGIHLDVEPWQQPQNKGAGNLQFLPGLVETYQAVVAMAAPAGMTVDADIQSKLLKGNLSQRRALLSAVPRLTLMMYELSSPQDGKTAKQKAEQVDAASQKYIAIAYDGLYEVNLAKMAIALRTADYGDLLPQMLRKLDDANLANPNYLGWARHSYNDTLPAKQ
jgi:hypothetical protein